MRNLLRSLSIFTRSVATKTSNAGGQKSMLERVYRLKETGQHDMALKALDELEKTYPSVAFKTSPFVRGEILGEKMKLKGLDNFDNIMKKFSSP